ncbi:MAG TPA: iron ABC transporter permease [bacterium]|jgi:iron(III) transport system permease protein|nr:iron ABC transporter permease [bacterium]
MAEVLTSPPERLPPARRRWLGVGAQVWIPSLLVAAAMLLPIAYLIIRAAGAGSEGWNLLLSARTARILLNTLLLATAVTATTVAVALPLAWLTVRTDLPGARWWTVLTALPLVVPSYVGGFVIATAFGPTGMLQQALEWLMGLTRLPAIYGFPGAWLTLSLFTYPYVLLSIRAGLRGIDPAVEEASRVLGQGAWTTITRVSLPMLRPWIGAGALLVALYVLSDFGAVSMMQFDSFTTAIYVQYQASFNRSYAAVLSLVLVVLTAVVLAIEGRSSRARFHRIGSAAARLARPVRLGEWRIPAVMFCGSVVALGVVLPASVVLYWLVAGLRLGQPLVVTLQPALNSVYASALSAGAAVLAGMPLAILAVRRRGALAAVITRLAYTGYALPGIVVALSLVFFAARSVPWLYQTMPVLVFAYLVLFLPQAVGTLRSALQQVSPSHEESARVLGRTPRQTLLSVTVPLVRPGAVAAAALVFLTTMKELPATLLLSPTGFETLATRIWSAATEGFFTRAAPPALLLLLISSLSMALLLSQERRGSDA